MDQRVQALARLRGQPEPLKRTRPPTTPPAPPREPPSLLDDLHLSTLRFGNTLVHLWPISDQVSITPKDSFFHQATCPPAVIQGRSLLNPALLLCSVTSLVYTCRHLLSHLSHLTSSLNPSTFPAREHTFHPDSPQDHPLYLLADLHIPPSGRTPWSIVADPRRVKGEARSELLAPPSLWPRNSLANRRRHLSRDLYNTSFVSYWHTFKHRRVFRPELSIVLFSLDALTCCAYNHM